MHDTFVRWALPYWQIGLLFGGLLTVGSANAQTLPSFPGAEGFGEVASGGRGGQVLTVTTLAADPAGQQPGSLNWALRQSGPRTIVFAVSGVIHAYADIVHGDVTIAGQTSPGGITVRGIVCDGHYERNTCDNLIIRHLRSRPAWNDPLPAGGTRLDDALRLDGVNRVMLDHLSLAHATDEVMQISWASDVSLQHSVLAETVGGHAELGGVLMNYAHAEHPQDRISLHHNLWFRLSGRMPEITCEASGYDDESPRIDACQNTPLQLELSNNLYADPGFPIWYGRWVDGNEAAGPYRVQLNLRGNLFLPRSAHPYGIAASDLLAEAQNSFFVSDNHNPAYPGEIDYALFYCCNDFPLYHPNADFGVATRRSEPHPFPAISLQSALGLQQSLPGRVGRLPNDTMDRRIATTTRIAVFPATPYGTPLANDALTLDFDPANPPVAAQDSDADGMPDVFESAHGLNPDLYSPNGTGLSLPRLGVPGYTDLEVYLHLTALALQADSMAAVFANGFE
ncbi:MAG: hypothetical protein IPO08_06265 [Xanthomonadales bacterium]|nr:hypothetical protein [Xanthomonadales bacterium]